MKHFKTVQKYNGTIEELSRDIVSLDYDGQVELFKCLVKDFAMDADNDKNNLGHPNVGKLLENISKGLGEILEKDMQPLANLCRAYNEKGIK